MILVEDNPTKTFTVPPGVLHYAWDDIERIGGDKAWIFSKRDSAIRAFGFYIAHKLDVDYVLTLDDDCFPSPGHEDLVDWHLSVLNSYSRWVPSIPGERTRGMPYQNLGKLDDVVANMGLWTNVADYDSIQTLHTKAYDGELGFFQPPHFNSLIPRDQYAPICGMNLFFAVRALPLFYFPLMGQGYPYKRMDDIWMGILAKKIADRLGWHISVGEPFIEHKRASDPFVNLVKEAPGIAANETFWEIIDRIELTAKTPTDVVRELGRELLSSVDEYITKLGKALPVWADLCEEPTVEESFVGVS